MAYSYMNLIILGINILMILIDALNKTPVNTSEVLGDASLIGATCALKISNDIWLSSLIGSLMSAIQVSREGNLAISANDIINQLNYKMNVLAY